MTEAEADNPQTIRKGVYLTALIYVEGEQSPAADFTALAGDSLKAALSKAGPLKMTLKKVSQTQVEEDDESADRSNTGNGKDSGEDGQSDKGKFEF